MLDGRPLRLVRLTAPQDRANAREQFAGIEGLGQIVIGANLQAHDPIDILAARSQQKNANLRCCPQPSQDFETIQPRQHYIQKHHGEPAAQSALQAGISAVLSNYFKAVPRKIALEYCAQLHVIVNQEYGFHAHP
jgi:hypothetical protein